MTANELLDCWYGYGVEIGGRVVAFRDLYTLVYPFQEGLLFDDGGDEGGTSHYFQIVDGETLVSLDPENSDNATTIGKLVEIAPEFPEATGVELTCDYFEKGQRSGQLLAPKGSRGVVVATSYWGRMFEVKFPDITLSLPSGYLKAIES